VIWVAFHRKLQQELKEIILTECFLAQEHESDMVVHHGVTVIMAGHSLGGALAVLNALALKCDPRMDNLVDHIFLFTAGCPRVLSEEARDNLLKSGEVLPMSVVNHRDTVPLVPPSDSRYFARGLHQENSGPLRAEQLFSQNHPVRHQHPVHGRLVGDL
jgi:Lipase (class 3)